MLASKVLGIDQEFKEFPFVLDIGNELKLNTMDGWTRSSGEDQATYRNHNLLTRNLVRECVGKVHLSCEHLSLSLSWSCSVRCGLSCSCTCLAVQELQCGGIQESTVGNLMQ